MSLHSPEWLKYTEQEIMMEYFMLFPDAAKNTEGGKHSPNYDPYFMQEVEEELGFGYDEIPDEVWNEGNKNFLG